MRKQQIMNIIACFLILCMTISSVTALQASCYGGLSRPMDGNPDPLNTTQTSIEVCDLIRSMGYDQSTAYRTDQYFGSANDAWGRMKTDNIFYFYGHGNPGLLSFSKVGQIPDYIIVAKTDGTPHDLIDNRISDLNGGELDDVVLAFYSACNSADTNTSNYGNLLDESVYRGVDTAIGFHGVVEAPFEGDWGKKFFEEQKTGCGGTGCNYNDSARYATDYIKFWHFGDDHGLSNYSIRGLVTGKITPARAGTNTINTYPVTVTSGLHGSINPISSDSFQPGESRTIFIQGGSDKEFLITPDPGYSIDSVSKDGIPFSPISPIYSSDYRFLGIWESGHTLTATFIPITQPPTAPVSDFGATITSGTAPLATTFVDNTTNHPTSWTWTFGDNTPPLTETGTISGPSHTYLQPGTYTVTLNATNAGGSSTKTRTGYITVTAAPPNERVTNGNMNSVDGWTTTNGGAGSGGTTAVTPYSYNGQTGGYLELDAFGDPGGTGNPGWANAQITQTVNLTDVRNLTFYLRSIGGSKPYSSSQHLDVWLDNNHLINNINPLGYSPSWTQSTFDVSGFSPGNHTIKFYTSTTNGGNIAIGVDTVSAQVEVIAPVASFNASPISGTVPLTVTFNDTSLNKPTTWAWDFGDGTSSTSKNMTHIYTSSADFTVKLTVANTAGSSNATKTIPVSTLSLLANFIANRTTGLAPLIVQFTDSSTGSPTSWNWNFGDGQMSTLRNPSHTFTQDGAYMVSLTVTSSGGSNTITKTGYIKVGPDKIGVTNGQQWYLDWNGNGAWDAGTDKAYTFGATGWKNITGDWNGDGKTEIGVTDGQQWYLDWNGNGAWDAGSDKAYAFGGSGWTPLVGDWNATGKSYIGVTNGQLWYLDWNGNGAWDAGTDKAYTFGTTGWTPVVGDWNPAITGTKIGVTNGQLWYLDWNGNGAWDQGTDKEYNFGAAGWIPVVGDWNPAVTGAKIGVYQNGVWYLDYNGNGTWDAGTDKAYTFGATGWTPLVGDWNTTGKSYIGVTNGQQWYLDWNGNGLWDSGTDKEYTFGANGWTPKVGKW